MHGKSYQTSHQLNTPLKNPSPEEWAEIEVIDPTHPLFGRHFAVLSISSPQQGSRHVFVEYRDYVVLRIPLEVTTLAPSRPTAPRTKLTSEAVTELIVLAEHCEVLCPLHPQPSGNTCPQIANNKLPMT